MQRKMYFSLAFYSFHRIFAIGDEAKDEYEINDERNYGYSSDEIRAIIDKLVEDDVVIRKGRSLRIAY